MNSDMFEGLIVVALVLIVVGALTAIKIVDMVATCG